MTGVQTCALPICSNNKINGAGGLLTQGSVASGGPLTQVSATSGWYPMVHKVKPFFLVKDHVL